MDDVGVILSDKNLPRLYLAFKPLIPAVIGNAIYNSHQALVYSVVLFFNNAAS